MRLSQILCRQHIGRHIKKHWRVQGVKRPQETNARSILESRGIKVVEPDDILKEKREFERVEVIGFKPKPVPLDERHPNWHEKVCYTYRDNNVLLEGLNQAKILTNTVEVKEGLPDKIILNDVDKTINSKVKDIIRYSYIFDAEQQKLPKIKDPLRPAFNFLRVYGITEERSKKLLIFKLLNLIELNSELEVSRNRLIFNDLNFSYPFNKNGDLVQFQLKGDTLLTSSQPLQQIHNGDTSKVELPNIYPAKETITLNREHIYEIKNNYPLDLSIPKCHPHTLFVHYHKEEVANLFGEEVTETQIFARSLLKAFTVGASYAKQVYGENVSNLPKPVTIQCVQTDGKLFHFGVLQINSLDLHNTNLRNIWCQTAQIPLFNNCAYVDGKPTLEGYNSEIIKHLFGFYNNM